MSGMTDIAPLPPFHKYNAERHQRICEAVRAGHPEHEAAALADISDTTLTYWKARGRKDEAAGRDTQFSRLLQDIAKARAERVARLLGKWDDKVDKDPRSADDIRKMLAATDPDHWSEKRVTQQHHHAVYGEVDHAFHIVQGNDGELFSVGTPESVRQLTAGRDPMELSEDEAFAAAALLLAGQPDPDDAVIDGEIVPEDEGGSDE
jgi:hypothetical protein